MEKKEIVKAGIFGVVIGDALGVPVEFTSRAERSADPVTDMREYGIHRQPKGTWSDDSSMMLATMDSMILHAGIRYDDIMERFRKWSVYGEYTPHGTVFDIGITCSRAISKYQPGKDPLQFGGCGERDNGNGSLMRIMPVSLYAAMSEEYWNEDFIRGAALAVHSASRLTHGHPRSLIGCMLYTSLCHELIFRGERPLPLVVQDAMDRTFSFYSGAKDCDWFDDAFAAELRKDAYGRLRDIALFKTLSDAEIKSSGYVVHTLEAAVWCLLNSSSFEECTLKAVNLGDDTDTVGAVAGGLAGLCYSYAGIPKKWIDVIVSKEWITKLCEDFAGITAER